MFVSCSKDDIDKIKKSPAEKLTFQKTGYVLKSVSNLDPNNIVNLTGSAPNFSLNVLKRGAFTATIVLEHPNKADVRITNCAFEITKLPAPTLTFQKVSKPFSSGGKFSTADILGGVRGTKTGYTVKNISNLNPSNLASVTSSKALNFSGSLGSFTATIILQHAAKADVTITGAQFEIYAEFLHVSNGGTVSLKSGVDKSTITSIIIPAKINNINVKAIGNYAFSGCSSLTSVTIPNSVTTIGIDAFEFCSKLTSVTIPNSVTYIGKRAFKDCTSLTSITIPSSLTRIGDEIFWGCYNLREIHVPTAKKSTWQSKLTFGNNARVVGY